MTLPFGDRAIDAVLFDLDDVLVPFQTLAAWQWAWRPQGPLLGERRVHAAVRRALKAWDRRRWAGVVGRQAPADLPALKDHLAATLTAIAGHPVPEADAVVRRMLHPAGEVERYPDVAPALARLAAAGVRVGAVTPLPEESARWLLKRLQLPESLLVGTGDPPGPVVPDKAAFRSAVERLGSAPDRAVLVGDLFWSDVRAAGRAGLAAILLDRHDAWPDVQAGRIVDLAGLEAALAAGGTATEAPEPPES
ncbi:MAG TPA: HAD-IA family hydrolase [Thermoplasmata archaeon]|nr:HAD-IA family hydrolase [Thermoplasmata archaeon]